MKNAFYQLKDALFGEKLQGWQVPRTSFAVDR
jgi:hypothetical protein